MRGKANITEGFLCIRHLDRCLLCARAVPRLTLVFYLLEAGVVEAYPLAGKAATLTIDSDHPRVETGISKIYTRKGACCPAGTVNGCKFVRSADYAGQDGHIKFFFEDEFPMGHRGLRCHVALKPRPVMISTHT